MTVNAEARTVAKRPGRALATVCAIVFLTFLDTTIVSVALADIQTKLHAGVSQLQWVVSAYALVFASLLIASGTIGDRLGRKKLMLGGLAVFAGGSLLGALSPNVDVLIASRAIMGLGAAASEPGTLSVLRHLYPDRPTFARALGAWAAVGGLALALGPVIGGVLVGIGGWQDVFWFNLAAGVAILLAAVVVVPESADPTNARWDVTGFFLGPASLGALVFAIILGETDGYRSPLIVTLFVLFGVLTAFAVWAELRSEAPMMDVRYLRKPPFGGAIVVAFCTSFGIFSIFFFTALYLQEVIGYSAYKLAVVFIPMAIAMVASAAVAGLWVARVGPRLPMAAGCTVAAAGVLLTEVALRGTVDFSALAVTLMLSGLGFGVAVVPTIAVALYEVPPEHSGMAASATIAARVMGSVIGVAVLGSLVNGHLTADLSARLTALGIPEAFQKVVITAVETGTVPSSGSGGTAAAEKAYGPIVAKVVGAAYGAFHTGLNISLVVAGVVILISGLVASFTLPSGRRVRDLDEAEETGV
jgi:EmrB/QacA subfamily drug resistance transporter